MLHLTIEYLLSIFSKSKTYTHLDDNNYFQEKWLFKNEEALKSVKKGLLESAKGCLKDRGRSSQYIKEK